MCVFRKRSRPLDFVLPVCFLMDHAKCLRKIKWEFVHNVHLSRQSTELGRGVVFLVGKWNKFIYFMTFYLLPNCSEHSENWKKGEKQQQPLPYSGKWQQKLVAWSVCLGQQLQIVGLIITRRQFRPSFDHSLRYLVYLLKEPAKMLWKK